MIRKAENQDIPAVARIYQHIHAQEQAKNIQIGWLPGVYPVEATARQALMRDDLFVYEQDGEILAAAIINQNQMDAYVHGNWFYPAPANQILVLHTLVVEPTAGGLGIGKAFVRFYEQYAAAKHCTVLRMDTNKINQRARGMYRKLGFREAGIISCNFNGIPNVQLVLLEKKI